MKKLLYNKPRATARFFIPITSPITLLLVSLSADEPVMVGALQGRLAPVDAEISKLTNLRQGN